MLELRTEGKMGLQKRRGLYDFRLVKRQWWYKSNLGHFIQNNQQEVMNNGVKKTIKHEA